MSGAMAGSAILAANARRNALSIVTLTVNNSCNLDCPHCYLRYHGPGGLVSDAVLDRVFESRCEGICIVGKEPLAGRRSVERVREIIEEAEARGKWISLITNGLNASMLSRDAARRLAWVDISVDGGPQTYESYRKGSWTKLLRAVSDLRAETGVRLRLLQTISSQTLNALDDMLKASELLEADATVFSPFQATRSAGSQEVSEIGPMAYVDAIGPYRQDPTLFITMDGPFADRFQGASAAIERGRSLFGSRFIYVDTDPIDRGLIRVTYDGLALTPFEAIHTAQYAMRGMPVADQQLDTIFDTFYRASRPSRLH